MIIPTIPKIAAAPTVTPPPYMAQLIPNETPTIPEVNDTAAQAFPNIIKLALGFCEMPTINKNRAPNADNIHAKVTNNRAMIIFIHLPMLDEGTPVHPNGKFTQVVVTNFTHSRHRPPSPAVTPPNFTTALKSIDNCSCLMKRT
ncbi:unnamed protein product [Rotaria socialis]|uniref:Uncharacterized protein n=1 Tax=Rotaria socialis TaxID=392032 RepID=A0A817Y0Y4_9BILA|nr:unnamed protein product [Rotaria socialis]CAF4494635.1 unnamed protein product [Rotaria socialis]